MQRPLVSKLPLLRPRHFAGLATLRTAALLGVDVDDVADRDNGATVGAGLSVGVLRSFGGHASQIAPRLSSEVAANPVLLKVRSGHRRPGPKWN